MKQKIHHLQIQKTHPDAILPQYAHPGDSGMDLFSIDDWVLNPGERLAFRTGIKIKLPQGMEAQIRPKSGLSATHGLVTSFGTIDEQYRGEIQVILYNHSFFFFKIKKGMKIAQMVIAPVIRATILEVDHIDSDTLRGEGGFGSTGE